MRFASAPCLLVALGAAAVLAGSASHSDAGTRKAMRFTHLSGVRFERNGLRWVRLRGTLCDPSPPKDGDYPESVVITHFAVPKKASERPGQWYAMRTSIDHPPSLVSLQEAWWVASGMKQAEQ